MDHGGGERRSGACSAHEAALRAVQRPAAKPWRGGGVGGSAGATAAAPPKVYRVAPRDFRELVQRLTGASTAAPAVAVAMGARHEAPVEPAPAYAGVVPAHGQSDAAAEMFDYASWFSVPLLSPASMPTAGYDGQLHGNGALL
uniref:VQ domain-containing protein n=1 Tax=Oryza punctata TaxID=4537 RepID=A0A0E0KHD5_ORYPU